MSEVNNPIHPVHGVPVPLTLVCTVSGKIVKYTAPDYIKAKIAEAGSLEKLLANFVSKGAHKRVAEAKSGKSSPDPARKPSTRSWQGAPVDPGSKTTQAPTSKGESPKGSDKDPMMEVIFLTSRGECLVSGNTSLMSKSLKDKDVIDLRPVNQRTKEIEDPDPKDWGGDGSDEE